MTSADSSTVAVRAVAVLRRGLAGMPAALRLFGLVVAVGMLIEFLPIDLAVAAVLVVSMHASMRAGLVWNRLRGWLRRR